MENKKRNLIDRDDLIDSLGISDMDIYAKECISEAPTVDAVEVVHGRWVHDKPWLFGFECDQCGKWILPEGTNGDMNYCSNCGARMDGGKHE